MTNEEKLKEAVRLVRPLIEGGGFAVIAIPCNDTNVGCGDAKCNADHQMLHMGVTADGIQRGKMIFSILSALEADLPAVVMAFEHYKKSQTLRESPIQPGKN